MPTLSPGRLVALLAGTISLLIAAALIVQQYSVNAFLSFSGTIHCGSVISPTSPGDPENLEQFFSGGFGDEEADQYEDMLDEAKSQCDDQRMTRGTWAVVFAMAGAMAYAFVAIAYRPRRQITSTPTVEPGGTTAIAVEPPVPDGAGATAGAPAPSGPTGWGPAPASPPTSPFAPPGARPGSDARPPAPPSPPSPPSPGPTRPPGGATPS